MSLTAIVLASLLGMTMALPLDDPQAKDGVLNTPDIATRNNAFEQALLDVLEELRALMLSGSEDVPVLDPFELDHLHLELDEFGIPGSHISLSNVVARQLSSFVIDHVSVSLTSLLLQRYTIELEGHIPILEGEAGNYDMSVTVVGFNVFGNGDAKVKIFGPRVKATLVVGPRLTISGLFLNMISCNIQFNLDAFQPELTGMFGSDITNEFVNLFLANLVPELLEYFEEDITDTLSSIVLEIGNEILRDLDLGSIIGGSNVAQIFDIAALQRNQEVVQ